MKENSKTSFTQSKARLMIWHFGSEMRQKLDMSINKSLFKQSLDGIHENKLLMDSV
jgi:hypothetical protein